MNETRKSILCIILSLVFLLCGCAKNKQLENNVSNIRIALGKDITIDELSNEERVNKMKIGILKVEGVKDASVVITGGTALIGINTFSKDSKKISEIKKNVVKEARTIDKNIDSTAITANSEIVQMISDLEQGKNT